MKAYAMQTRTELLLSLRQGEQMLVSIGIPLLVLVFFSLTAVLPIPDAFTEPVDFLTPGVLALAIMSSAMVSLGIGTGFERQYGVLKRLGATPLGRGRLIGAKISMVLILEVIQFAVLITAALVLGWRPEANLAATVLALVLGTAAFAGLGLTLAGTLSGTANLAVVNGLYLLLLLLGGMVVPLDRLPGGVRVVAELLPSSALSEALQGALSSQISTPVGAWLVLTAWAITMPLAAAKLFRWE